MKNDKPAKSEAKHPRTDTVVPAMSFVRSDMVPAFDTDLHIPLSSQAVFWRPRHLVASPMVGQLPFLFWLMESLEPKIIVQHGLGDGLVYMALCQAAERMNDNTILIGLAEKDAGLPDPLQRDHDAQYADFSTLRCGLNAEALTEIVGPASESKIDLLLIHHALDAEAWQALEADWLPRLSDSGVILVCDPDTTTPQPEVRRDLLAIGPSMVLGPTEPSASGKGIAVVIHGRTVPDRIKTLVALRPGKPAYLAARQVFNRLGSGLEALHKVATLEARHAAQEALTSQARKDLAISEERTAENAHLETRVSELSAALDEQIEDLRTQLNAAQAKHEASAKITADRLTEAIAAQNEVDVARQKAEAKVVELNAQQIALRAELDAVNARLAEADASRVATETEAQRLREDLRRADIARQAAEAALGQAHTHIESLERARDARIEDIVVLSTERQEYAAQAQAEISALRIELDKAASPAEIKTLTDRINLLLASLKVAERSREDLKAQMKDLAEYNEALLRSTSWRLTAPMRKLKQAMTRRD